MKQKMKKLTCLLLAAVMLISLLPLETLAHYADPS